MAEITKAAWLAEGKKLGANASENCWLIGEWLVAGEQTFLGTVPTSKKAKKKYFTARKANWEALMDDAAKVTGLRDNTLRQYARVVRRGLRVEALSFAHHLEVMRCHTVDAKTNKKNFDAVAAKKILQKAQARTWTVARTREEMQKQFPSAVPSNETPLQKAKRLLAVIVKSVPAQKQLTFLDALASELPTMKTEIEEREEAYVKQIQKEMSFGKDEYELSEFPTYLIAKAKARAAGAGK